MRLRVTYSKTGLIRFISHLDLMRLLFRAFARAEIPVAYSQGFSPHPRFEFCPPLKVGMAGLGELLEVELLGEIDIPAAIGTLNGTLPSGVGFLGARMLSPSDPPLSKAISGAEYAALLPKGWALSPGDLEAFLSRSAAPVIGLRKGKTGVTDARPGVLSLSLGDDGKRELQIGVSLPGARPTDVLKALTGKSEEELQGALWRRIRFVGERL